MIGKYFINNVDIFLQWGIIIKKGVFSELLRFPKRKELLTHNWNDEHGTERDDTPLFDSMKVSMDIVFIAANEADFWTKYTDFYNFILASGYFVFRSEDLNKEFIYLYDEMTPFKNLTPITQGNKVYSEFTITFINDDVGSNEIVISEHTVFVNRGEKGETGDQGPIGPVGPAGPATMEWNGQLYTGAANANPSGEIIAYDATNGDWRPTTLEQLGLGSAAYLSPSIAGSLAQDLEVSKYLRWKNYGTNHVIIDASNSLSPTGTSINNTNSDSAWSPTYPTLVGWNGSNTYGVRVDSARAADHSTYWGGLTYYGGGLAANVAYAMVYDSINGRQGVASVAQMQGFLGLGSNAYSSIGYLPLTGGTLTGALNGTISEWNGLVTFNANPSARAIDIIGRATDDVALQIFWNNAKTVQNAKFTSSSSGLLIDGALTLANALTGTSASFSSTLGIGRADLSGNLGLLNVSYPFAKTDDTERNIASWTSNESSGSTWKLLLTSKGGATTASRFFSLQTGNEGVANEGILALQAGGGSVLIGTATDNGTDKLQVNGSIAAGSANLSGSLSVGGTVLSGVAKLGAWASSGNYARFGHYSFDGGSNYGFLQHNTGSLHLNGTTLNVEATSSTFSGTVTAPTFSGSATKWNNQIYTGGTNANPSGELMAYDATNGDWRPTTKAQLGIAASANPSFTGFASFAGRAAVTALSLDGTDTDNWSIKKNGTNIDVTLNGVAVGRFTQAGDLLIKGEVYRNQIL